ncbi:MAG: alpha-amylase family glycosyl hydrolase [Bacteroidota bacterium]|nr:alpha-amylase family glycosyl hydrolase [Bacteroidota bacterium]
MKRTLIALSTVFMITSCSTKQEVAPKDFTALPKWAIDANIYEVNVRQHTKEGTLQAFQSHLPRLAKMGVDILWFMPIQPIGVINRKGDLGSYYSISDYTGINPNFGTLKDFQGIVNEAHELGMEVILDWVANHTSFDHHWVQEKPTFYTQDTQGNSPIVALDNNGNATDWTDVADLNYNNEELREAMISEMDWWVTNTGIDGFRCDVAGFVPYGFWKDAITTLRSKHGPLFMLAEWEDPALIQAGFNAVYGWEFHHIMNEVAQGYKSVQAIADYALKSDSIWPSHTMKMYFNTNHDENSWNGTVKERMGNYGNAMYVLATLMKRSFPLIYSGQEAGLNHRYPFFSKDSIGLDWESKHPQAEFFEKMLSMKHKYQALHNGKYGYDMVLEIDTTTNSMRIVRANPGEQNSVIGIFEFGKLSSTYEEPQNLELLISVNGAKVWGSRLD